MLSKKDLQFLNKKEITPEKITEQINQFINGFPTLDIIKPALVKDGIKQLTDKMLDEKIKVFEKSSKKLKSIKFVPASGAATRMFKTLYDAMNHYHNSEEEYLRITTDNSFQSVNYLCKNLQNLAFYNELKQAIEMDGCSLDEISKKRDLPLLVQYLLTEKGLNYGNLPKGLIKFHKTDKGNRTPLEEHLIEGMDYAASGKKIYLHFTVSPQHLDLFKKQGQELVAEYKKKTKFKIHITFSIQKPSTDTIAVDEANLPLRDQDGNILLRPGGHGALIYNLMDLDADLIFIKNIDNVVQDRLKNDTIRYKKALAGVLLETRETAQYYYKKLISKITNDQLDEAEEFIEKRIFILLSDQIKGRDKDTKAKFYANLLNRPYRVCGMVPNEGEPGGGPYWVKNADGTISMQIVEGSQFTQDQKVIMQKATHFNPVDLVCCIKDFKGKKYDLTKFIDSNTGFIATKSTEGQSVKALELPGLWNGSMALWNTIFVEVPITTFNPVKTVNDLLRAEHLFEQDLLKGEAELKMI
ncbi:MAG: DUF4301 family protein [Salinivirgaceae bacterium]|jgi:hypothetical protein